MTGGFAAFVVLCLAVLGVVLGIQKLTDHPQPAVQAVSQPVMVQCQDGSIQAACPPVTTLQQPPPAPTQPPVVIAQPAPQQASDNGSTDTQPLAIQTDNQSQSQQFSDSGSSTQDQTLSINAVQPHGVPGSQTVSVASGDAAVIQAYQINGRQMCQVAGVIGPARVSVTDGEYFYFSGVNASAQDLRSPMDEAAQQQQNDPNAHCNASHTFIIQ